MSVMTFETPPEHLELFFNRMEETALFLSFKRMKNLVGLHETDYDN
jgi:hypothetical protein